MTIPSFEDIITPNDQTEARKASLEAIAALVGNVYPNKFVRSAVSGVEDTITALKHFDKVADVEARMAEIKASLGEGERPPAEKKDALNEELKALGTVRIAGRLTTPTRGNFVHLTDGKSKLQVYCKKGQFVVGTQAASLRVADEDETRRQAACGPTIGIEDSWTVWTLLDHGDLIGVEGYLFVTNTGEVSVHVEKLQFLAKAMLPMPDKMHGIADPELQRRYRYADLIASSLQVKGEPPASAGGVDATGKGSGENETASTPGDKPPAYAGGSPLTTREVFERRAKLVSGLRRFLDDAGFIEVETPMLTPKATGAAAKPFSTHHNALGIDLYARVAPELYLKRLVVGGFEKVYELNRNFRNEGLSQRHNPEFTMLEFYVAYMDAGGMMDLAETMIKDAVTKANDGSLVVKYGENEIDFGKFERLTMKDAIGRHFPMDFIPDFDPTWLDDGGLLPYLERWSQWVYRNRRVTMLVPEKFATEEMILAETERQGDREESTSKLASKMWGLEMAKRAGDDSLEDFDSNQKSTSIASIFEYLAEEHLNQPTFIVDYPKSISPLSKASPENPDVAERFELFINGMEVANGFSELNDPKEQYERFVDQMSLRIGGDEEAMILDEDYIRALSYGMPPAAGIGIGIDRLVMLLTNKHSIRDVILFPHMRPEKGSSATADTESTEGN